MPRGKKESSSKKTKKVNDHSEEEDIEIENEEGIDEPEAESKKSKKTKGTKTAAKKGKKEKEEEAAEIEQGAEYLSELEDIDCEAPAAESGEHDQVISTQKPERSRLPVRDPIDDTKAIKDLKVEEILQYLIDKGKEMLNPQLKNGAIVLLQKLKGTFRPKPRYGSKSNRGFNPRDGRYSQGHSGGRGGSKTRYQSTTDIYGDK